MDAAWRRASWAFLGLVLGTGLVGYAAIEAMLLGARSFVVFLFAVPFVAATLAAHHYRHHGASTMAVALGAASGFFAQASLLGLPLLLVGLEEGFGQFDVPAVTLMLLVVPLAMGAVSGLGTAVLVHGVKRYRARHGMVHAPH